MTRRWNRLWRFKLRTERVCYVMAAMFVVRAFLDVNDAAGWLAAGAGWFVLGEKHRDERRQNGKDAA